MEEEYTERCPNCNEEWGGYECDTCGFADSLPKNEYESPTGFIDTCTEEEALLRGYLYICPKCESYITWWEHEDHGVCIDCWHSQNMIDKA